MCSALERKIIFNFSEVIEIVEGCHRAGLLWVFYSRLAKYSENAATNLVLGAWRSGGLFLSGASLLRSVLVPLPDNSQPFQCQKFVNGFDVAGRRAYQRCLSARGDHFRLRSHGLLHALQNAVNQIGIPVKKAGLH